MSYFTAPKMRIDRIASLGLFHPVVDIFEGVRHGRIPILMYHGIREGTSRVHPYYETNTAPRVFAEQMKLLYDDGYEAVDLGTALQYIRSGDIGSRRVVITFDDGLCDIYKEALPILRKFGFSATVFVPTGLISDQRSATPFEEFLTWGEIRELISCGFRIGSHTISHPQLRLLKIRDIDHEVGRSKQHIEDKTGTAVTSFSYPFAFPQSDRSFRRILKEILEKHAYQSGVCTIIGTAGIRDDGFFLPRLPVNSYDDRRLFQAKLEGGYNWVRVPQYAVSVYKRWREARGAPPRSTPENLFGEAGVNQSADFRTLMEKFPSVRSRPGVGPG